MDVVSLPRRHGFSLRPGPAPLSAEELPPYTPTYTRRNTLAQPLARREPTEHVYYLSEKSRPWVTLKLYSSAKSPQSLPTFFEKENINGSLEINAERGDSIQSITAIVTGRIITGSNARDTITFLSQSLPVWSKFVDVPRLPSLSEGASQNKLLGHCQWALSIPLPRTVNIPNSAGGSDTCQLPETFLERHTTASIQYDFTLLISRGKLRSDCLIKTAFGYVPTTRPDRPSLLQQLAYQHGHPLPGPQSDPDGWSSLRPVVARGVMRHRSKVEVHCVLSLAKPLCYTRGSVLPCFLTLQNSDEKMLDLFSAPSAITMKLQRRVRFFNTPSHPQLEVAWRESCEDVGGAVWWPAAGIRSSANTRHLEGEIRLTKNLRPTTSVGHFSITYQVVLRCFDVQYFKPDNDRALLSEPIEIATMHGKGPRPQASSPPAYASTTPSSDDCYSSPPYSGPLFGLRP